MTPTNCAHARSASSAGESNPIIGSFVNARNANGKVLKKNSAITSTEADTFGLATTSSDNAQNKAGANMGCSLINCGVWLSLIPFRGFLRTAFTRQKANLYF